MTTPQTTDLIRHSAHYYASLGLFPIELVGPTVPRSNWVKSPGKQPAHKSWQTQDRPSHPDTYVDGCNLGLRMGVQSNKQLIVAVDIDCQDPAELLKIAPAWPQTLTSKTGKGGYHALYVWPAELEPPKNGVRLKGLDGQKTQIDIRADGGQIAVYPSVHPDTGATYAWENWGHDIVDIPVETAQAILSAQKRLTSGSKAASIDPQRTSPVGYSLGLSVANQANGTKSVDLSTSPHPLQVGDTESGAVVYFEVSRELWKRTLAKLSRRADINAAAFERLSRGLAFAEPGCRDDRITSMCWALARELPQADPSSIAYYFEGALNAMHAISPFAAPCDVALKFRTAVAKQSTEVPEVDLIRSSMGSPVQCVENVIRVLRTDRQLYSCFVYDEFAERILVSRVLPWEKPSSIQHYPRQITDRDFVGLCAYSMAQHRLAVKTQMAAEAIDLVAHENGFHPVREYLLECAAKWDGVNRLDTWLQQYMGAEDSEVVRRIGRWWLMQAVARATGPGIKADYCLIFEGQQGRKKSMALAVLAGEAWFSDDLTDVGSKESAQKLSGKWIVELSELSCIRGAQDVNRIKAFITRQSDRYRVPYGRVAQDFPRSSVFAGSTNDAEYLTDPTGNRRFWPVAVADKDADVEGLRAIRDLLWAEACLALARGEKYYPDTQAEKDALAAEVDKRRSIDSWEDKLAAWAENPIGLAQGESLTTAVLLARVFGVSCSKRSDDQRITQCLRVLGWKRSNNGTGRDWVPPVPLPSAGQGLATVVQLKVG